MTMSQTNADTMRRLVEEVINNKCLAVIDQIIHPNYVYRAPGQTLHGRQALRELFTDYQTAFPNLQVKIDELICTDNKAVLLFTLSGTHESELMGIPPTGKQVNINGMICSRLENGQIIEEWELLDQLTLFQQLGIVSL
jgi:steroid delta-isomerase-like uncharacterized protein